MTISSLKLNSVRLPPETEALRQDVRAFLESEERAGTFVPKVDSWLRGFSRDFSRKLGSRGWLGITWPREWGGGGRGQLDRFVIVEELIAAGAPVAAHWAAERQIGPTLLKFGTQEQKQSILPAIMRGECTFSICYSEADVGSDLAGVKTKAVRDGKGWRITGNKLWTSAGHEANYLVVLARTNSDTESRHDGLTLFAVALPAQGLTARPIRMLNGEHHFNEMVFDGVYVDDSAIVGELDHAWKVITSDLAYERSGPERFMSTVPLLREMIRKASGAGEREAIVLGELVARYRTLRAMSISVAAGIQEGRSPALEAALVKEMGTRFEGDVIEVARSLWPDAARSGSSDRYADLLAQATLQSPVFKLRGGTNEIMYGIIARGLGVR